MCLTELYKGKQIALAVVVISIREVRIASVILDMVIFLYNNIDANNGL
jgi:hypothetical protein